MKNILFFGFVPCLVFSIFVDFFEKSLESPKFLFSEDDFELVCKFPLMAARRPTTIQLDKLTGTGLMCYRQVFFFIILSYI